MTCYHHDIFEGWSDTDSGSSIEIVKHSETKKRGRSHGGNSSNKRKRLQHPKTNVVEKPTVGEVKLIRIGEGPKLTSIQTSRTPSQTGNEDLSAQLHTMKQDLLSIQRATGRHIICLITSILAAEVLDTISLNYTQNILKIAKQLKAMAEKVRSQDRLTSDFLQARRDDLVNNVEKANNRRMVAFVEMNATPYFQKLVFEHGEKEGNHEFRTKQTTANMHRQAYEASAVDPEDFSVLIDWFQNYMRRNFQSPPSV